MNMALWAVQVLLALVFGLSGGMKTFMTIEALSEMLTWINHVPGWVPRLAGISELLAMAGLLLPSITRVRPELTPLAASGLVIVMVLGGALHAAIGESGTVPLNVVLGGLAAFVAWGRFVKLPIEPRGAAQTASGGKT